MLNVEHDVVFTAHNKDGKFDLIHGSLQSGNIYLLDTPCLIPDLLASLDYLDERIIISFVKKIVAEKKVPLIAFTREDLAFKIVTGRHVVQAALKLGKH